MNRKQLLSLFLGVALAGGAVAQTIPRNFDELKTLIQQNPYRTSQVIVLALRHGTVSPEQIVELARQGVISNKALARATLELISELQSSAMGSGGGAVLRGVDLAQLREIIAFLEQHGLDEVARLLAREASPA